MTTRLRGQHFSPALADVNSIEELLNYGAHVIIYQKLERTAPGEEVVGSIPAVAARGSLLVGSVSV